MRFLVDQDVYATTAAYLAALGHDVVRVAELGMATAADAAILAATQAKQRILVTRDRDFGGLVFVQETGAGVVYLRITPSTQLAVHEELARVITSYTEEELRSSFVVVEPARHRIRRLGKKEQSE